MVYRDTVGILTHTKSVDSFILRLISHLVYFVRTTTMSRLTCGRWDASMLSCCKCWIQSQISGAGGHFDVHVPSHLPADPRKALIMRTLHSFFCVRTAVLSLFSDTTLECRSWKNTWQDRGPLFPGSSCYPLSPDRKHRKDPRFHTCLCRQLHQAVLDWMELDAFHPHDLCVEIYKTKHFAHVDTSTSNCLRSFLDVFF